MGVENEDVVSPDTSAPETQQDAAPETDQVEARVDEGAGSSDAPPEGDKEPGGIADVVRDAVEKPKPEAASPAEKSDDPEDGTDADAKTEPKEDYSDVPFHNHPRFKQLVAEKNTFKQGHEQFQNIRNFLDQSGVSDDEAGNMLSWLALRKVDPVKAFEQVKPIIQQLAVEAGAVIPNDLRQMVRDGKMTEEGARLVARERAERARAQGALERQQQTFQRTSEAREAQARREAVASWEMRRQKDPDFGALQGRLTEKVLFLQHTQGKPNSIEGINQQLDEAWKAVKAEARAAQPRRPEIKPVTGGRTAGSPAPQPKSVLDIVRAHAGG